MMVVALLVLTLLLEVVAMVVTVVMVLLTLFVMVVVLPLWDAWFVDWRGVGGGLGQSHHRYYSRIAYLGF